MKNSIQMNVAKHMIAVWADVNNSDSLKNSFGTINSCWPNLSRRELRTWSKAIHENPERYQFTGYAYKTLKLSEHFTEEEVSNIITTVEKLFDSSNYDNVIRSIIHHKWVYGLNTEQSITLGIESYNTGTKQLRPEKPSLKSINK